MKGFVNFLLLMINVYYALLNEHMNLKIQLQFFQRAISNGQ